MAERKSDIVVIGAGPNGLQIGAYLAKAGLNVQVLERRHECGGGLATEAVTLTDFIHNTHAVYMMMVDYAPIYKDLKLEEQYDVKHIYPHLQFALPLSDGKCVCIYSDLEKTCESLAKFSQKDADSYRELYHRMKTWVDKLIAPATYVPAVPTLEQLVKLQQTELGRDVIDFAEKAPNEIIDEYFENEHVKALMLYLATQWGLEYDQGGLGFLVLLYLNRASNYRLVAGGSHMVAQALNKVVHENGGSVLNNQRIKRIIIEDGTAKGVEMENGNIIWAEKAVVSTIDPRQTFLNLVGNENLEDEFQQKIKLWKWEEHSLLGIHLALEEAPHFTAADSNPEIDKAFVYVLGYETPDDLIQDYGALLKGELSDKASFNCCFPTVHDPSQAPEGKHTGLISRFAPYKLNGDQTKWYGLKLKEQMAENCLATLKRYAPNMSNEKILWKYVSTPLDMENKFLDMVEGSFKQGLYTPLQMGYQRPNDECSQNRTPVKNLYIGGSSCYPGGCVIWGSGYLAADTIAEDLGITKWWPEPEIVVEARKEGLI